MPMMCRLGLVQPQPYQCSKSFLDASCGPKKGSLKEKRTCATSLSEPELSGCLRTVHKRQRPPSTGSSTTHAFASAPSRRGSASCCCCSCFSFAISTCSVCYGKPRGLPRVEMGFHGVPAGKETATFWEDLSDNSCCIGDSRANESLAAGHSKPHKLLLYKGTVISIWVDFRVYAERRPLFGGLYCHSLRQKV